MGLGQVAVIGIVAALLVLVANLVCRPITTLRTLFAAIANILVALMTISIEAVLDILRHLLGEETMPIALATLISFATTIGLVLLGAYVHEISYCGWRPGTPGADGSGGVALGHRPGWTRRRIR